MDNLAHDSHEAALTHHIASPAFAGRTFETSLLSVHGQTQRPITAGGL